MQGGVGWEVIVSLGLPTVYILKSENGRDGRCMRRICPFGNRPEVADMNVKDIAIASGKMENRFYSVLVINGGEKLRGSGI